MQHVIVNDVDVAAEQILQVMHECNMVQQRAILLHVNQNVQVASFSRLAAND